ncbi:MAG TPA: DUF5916 domain-containing protein, partial [Ferruginibacter sp.]|nr:DUF5916 domain-containing protein [Ferruginibacter sp.]
MIRQFTNKFLLTGLFMLSYVIVRSQDTARSIQAQRVNQVIKIDGELNEEAWKSAPVINKFVEQRPVFGRSEAEKTKTEMWILYNDNAVYVAGFCHESTKDSISSELAGRDNPGINDFAGIMFDTYRDKINGVGFYVTALGEQFDSKYSLNNEDLSWSTVYQTATKITTEGWFFEMKIPYSALRFSNNQVQSWGINFIRKRTKAGRQFTWNPLNPNVFGLMSQCGILTNVENIKSPIRLSFSPYFSSYLSQAPGQSKKWASTVNGGMDVKYGISKSFTLDMTLIPDFGQVQSDNQVLNLSPFEVRYNEKRSFFTEGTELFNKGNLFYSRRVGGVPLNYSLPGIKGSDSATVIKNPIETKLVNATKISGRTAKGLGIAFFNAITKPQNAIIEDSNHVQFEYQTNPWTNYNILVVDQTLKNSSSITLVNTNVLRNGKDYDANVIAGLFDLYDNNVSWNI